MKIFLRCGEAARAENEDLFYLVSDSFGYEATSPKLRALLYHGAQEDRWYANRALLLIEECTGSATVSVNRHQPLWSYSFYQPPVPASGPAPEKCRLSEAQRDRIITALKSVGITPVKPLGFSESGLQLVPACLQYAPNAFRALGIEIEDRGESSILFEDSWLEKLALGMAYDELDPSVPKSTTNLTDLLGSVFPGLGYKEYLPCVYEKNTELDERLKAAWA